MSILLAFASSYGSSYGYSSSADLEYIVGLLGGMICVYLIPAILSIVAVIWSAHMAQQKGRSAAGWVALSLFFGIIPFIVLCCLPSLKVTRPASTPSWSPRTQQTWSAPQAPTVPQVSATSAPTPAPAKVAIVVTCPSCQRKMKVGEQSANKKVRCPSCAAVITLKNGVPQPPAENQGE